MAQPHGRGHHITAIAFTEYGSPEGLELRDIPTLDSKDGEMLVRIYAATVTAGTGFGFDAYAECVCISADGVIVNKPATLPTDPTPEDLAYLCELVNTDRLRTIVDRRYRLEEVPEAHRYVDAGQKVGYVMIRVADAQEKST